MYLAILIAGTRPNLSSLQTIDCRSIEPYRCILIIIGLFVRCKGSNIFGCYYIIRVYRISIFNGNTDIFARIQLRTICTTQCNRKIKRNFRSRSAPSIRFRRAGKRHARQHTDHQAQRKGQAQ